MIKSEIINFNEFLIDLQGYANGLYILKIETEKGLTILKIEIFNQ
jgi:hypothetical protein